MEKDGGPAFPVALPMCEKHELGISVLDYFAGQAQPEALKTWEKVPPGEFVMPILARFCYDFADAMLAERERRFKEVKPFAEA